MDIAITEQKAIKAALNSNWQEAIKLNKALLKEGVQNVGVYNRLGKAYSETDNWENAVKSFEKALKIDPVNSVAQKGIVNSKMNRRAGVSSAISAKDALIRDFSTTQLIEISSKGLNIDKKYELLAKNDFFILNDVSTNKQLKRISKSKLNLKSGVSPEKLEAKVINIVDETATLKITSTVAVFKAEKQMIDPTLELEEKDVQSEKKEIEELYRVEE